MITIKGATGDVKPNAGQFVMNRQAAKLVNDDMKTTPNIEYTQPIVAVNPNLGAFLRIKVNAFHAAGQKESLVSATQI